jgi:hypothetical protein
VDLLMLPQSDEYLHLPYLDPDDKLPGLGLTINEESMKEFQIIE